MLTIRDEQIAELESLLFRDFENGMVVHNNAYFPQTFEWTRETVTRELIRHGIVRAEHYETILECEGENLLIREEQLGQFEEQQYLAFERKLADWLEKQFPVRCRELGPIGICDQIRYLAQNAIRYRFESQQHVAGFVYIGFLLGPDFDLAPEYAGFKSKLSAPRQSADERMENTWNELMAQPRNAG